MSKEDDFLFEEIWERYHGGESVEEIANRLNIGPQRLALRLARSGAENPPPDREDYVSVYIDTPKVRGWFTHKRSPLDRLDKKHLVVLKDDDGNVIGHTWLTSEEKLKMRLEREFNK